ncbi:hypothetical protein GDO81_027579 [Engystomops pustulosus]|uniref:Uncharacterized protein n=1 Tax=Engystomops pustulosus TaxID=76066 RepID=A0AAV6Z7Z0_ENGPU|nr:hypothetical protein GDO81_027579 [Engystomops pustulosus]
MVTFMGNCHMGQFFLNNIQLKKCLYNCQRPVENTPLTSYFEERSQFFFQNFRQFGTLFVQFCGYPTYTIVIIHW